MTVALGEKMAISFSQQGRNTVTLVSSRVLYYLSMRHRALCRDRWKVSVQPIFVKLCLISIPLILCNIFRVIHVISELTRHCTVSLSGTRSIDTLFWNMNPLDISKAHFQRLVVFFDSRRTFVLYAKHTTLFQDWDKLFGSTSG